jgi:hypothetical protein
MTDHSHGPSSQPDAAALEELRKHLAANDQQVRLRALSQARSLDAVIRRRLIVTFNITGQTPMSDEMVTLLAENWESWPALTSLCLRGCWLLSETGCAVIARQGRITDLEIAGIRLTSAMLGALATLPLRRLEIWDETWRTQLRSLPPAGMPSLEAGAVALAAMPTLTTLDWYNGPDDAAVTRALATSRTLTDLTYSRGKGNADVMLPLTTMTGLTQVQLSGVEDAALVALAGLPRLESLILAHPNITAEGLTALRGCPSLRVLHLMGIDLFPDDLLVLGELRTLEEIRIHGDDGTEFTDTLAGALGSLPRLRSLRIHAPADLSDAGVASLTRATGLKEMWLDRCARVTDAAMPHIARLTAMDSLHLSGTGITDAGARYLAGLPGLCELTLRNTAITPLALPALKPLTGLRILDCSNCHGLAPLDIEPLLGMAELDELNLQETGTLHADQTRRLAQYCRKLRKLRCGLTGQGALAPLILITGLRSLWISGADGITDDELTHLVGLRELWSLVITDAPWLSDAGLETLARIPGLKAVGLAGCPGLTPGAVTTLANRLHLELMPQFSPRMLTQGNFVVLSGQCLTDGDVPGFAMSPSGRTRERQARKADTIPGLARQAVEPYRPPHPAADVRPGQREPDAELVAEMAIRTLEEIGTAAVVPALAAALRIGPTRWAHAGWALVRLCRAELFEAGQALQHLRDHGETASERERGRRFLQLAANAPH